MEFFTADTRNALEAKEYAQWIAFAPMVFQASRIMRDNGILQQIEKTRRTGITLEDLVEKVKLPTYNVRVLLEAGLGIGLVYITDGKYFLTKTGYFIYRW